MSESKNKSSKFDSIVWLIIIAAIGILVFLAIPNFIKARHISSANACINNLREIDAAKKQWALENNKTNGTVVTETDIKPYIKLDKDGNLPKCPQDGIYSIGKVGEPPTCSLGKTNPVHVLP